MNLGLKYYVDARPGDVAEKRIHARDCRYLIGPVTEVQHLRGKSAQDVLKMQNVCNVCIGSKRFQQQGEKYHRQRTTGE